MSALEPVMNITPIVVWNPNYFSEVDIPLPQRGQGVNPNRWVQLPPGVHYVIVDSNLPFPLQLRHSDNGLTTLFHIFGTVPANAGTSKMFTLVITSDQGGYLTVHPATLQSEEVISGIANPSFGIRIILGEAYRGGKPSQLHLIWVVAA